MNLIFWLLIYSSVFKAKKGWIRIVKNYFNLKRAHTSYGLIFQKVFEGTLASTRAAEKQLLFIFLTHPFFIFNNFKGWNLRFVTLYKSFYLGKPVSELQIIIL